MLPMIDILEAAARWRARATALPVSTTDDIKQLDDIQAKGMVMWRSRHTCVFWRGCRLAHPTVYRTLGRASLGLRIRHRGTGIS